MKFNNRQNRCIAVGGEQLWISRSVTVLPALFLVQGEQTYVPLGLRGYGLPDECGKWALPGGYLDYDETAGEAVIREIWEEMGLNIPDLQSKYRFEGSLDQPYYVLTLPRNRQNVTLRFPLMFFLPETQDLPALNPQVGVDEVIEAKWFQLSEALAMPLAFYHHEVIRHCLAHYYKDIWPGSLADIG
ncbi:NUDIX domain-containing protein [Lyngbya confervoides]|uniref:NUDIX domain-containing protein n=1 Tax=Lyngbya confervoides BDU141951 TaxID=1574623 RepID=A0ABD4T839_9CYAN|nr:NUDIX domain-containing protein [Lyngbya confervoides]MCM1984796.1 NUDIX domain-containing protein [Lyngbya confervoides BDU141951]